MTINVIRYGFDGVKDPHIKSRLRVVRDPDTKMVEFFLVRDITPDIEYELFIFSEKLEILIKQLNLMKGESTKESFKTLERWIEDPDNVVVRVIRIPFLIFWAKIRVEIRINDSLNSVIFPPDIISSMRLISIWNPFIW